MAGSAAAGVSPALTACAEPSAAPLALLPAGSELVVSVTLAPFSASSILFVVSAAVSAAGCVPLVAAKGSASLVAAGGSAPLEAAGGCTGSGITAVVRCGITTR